MFKLVVLFSVVALALGLPAPAEEELPLVFTDYHNKIGIPAARLIKASEEARDFDGNRIVGGSAADLGQHPYFAGLLISLLGTTAQSVCGASLVSNTRLVTAAHCWVTSASQATQFEVVLGSTSLFFGGLRVVSSDVVVHEQWDDTTIVNDVGVIKINWIDYTDIIWPISLPSGSLLNDDFTGQSATAVGYGRQSDGILGAITVGIRLHHTSLNVISNQACSTWFGDIIVDSTLCIDGSDFRSTCGGDSGGPLALDYNGENVLIGITSFGYRWGCEQGWPAAFARVNSFLFWIQAHL